MGEDMSVEDAERDLRNEAAARWEAKRARLEELGVTEDFWESLCARTVPAAVAPVLTQLRTFRALILDADGVWFDGKQHRTADGDLIKTRDLRDGQGLSFLRALGIRVLFATSGGAEPLRSNVDELNGLPSCRSGKWAPVGVATDLKRGKSAVCEAWMSGLHEPASWADCVYVGDDMTDVSAMRACVAGGGLVVVPSDAQRVARRHAHLVLTKPGGGGAVRELAELALDARGVDEATLEFA